MPSGTDTLLLLLLELLLLLLPPPPPLLPLMMMVLLLLIVLRLLLVLCRHGAQKAFPKLYVYPCLFRGGFRVLSEMCQKVCGSIRHPHMTDFCALQHH